MTSFFIFKENTCLLNLRVREISTEFGKEIYWKTFIWKTSKGWKDNIVIDFIESGSVDDRWLQLCR